MGNRLLRKEYPGEANDDVFTHDLASRLLTAECQRYANIVSRGYDKAGRLGSEAVAIDGQTFVVRNGYDPANRQVVVTYPDGRTITFADYGDGREYSGMPNRLLESFDEVPR